MRPIATREEFDKYFTQLMDFLPGQALDKEIHDKSYDVYLKCAEAKNKIEEKNREEYLKADIFRFVVAVLNIEDIKKNEE